MRRPRPRHALGRRCCCSCCWRRPLHRQAGAGEVQGVGAGARHEAREGAGEEGLDVGELPALALLVVLVVVLLVVEAEDVRLDGVEGHELYAGVGEDPAELRGRADGRVSGCG